MPRPNLIDTDGCPRCGCPEAESLGEFGWWGRPQVRCRCTNCGCQYQIAESIPTPRAQPAEKPAERPQRNGDAVIYHVLRCPKCNSPKVRVYRTMLPVRYHKCHECGHRFKSVEKQA